MPLRPSGVRVSGTIPVSARLVSSGGGRVSVKRVGPWGARRWAARFPRFGATDGAPAAALLVKSRSADDALDPVDRDFTFGATVRVDTTSESDAAGSTDNGNNVVQKGLYLDQAQYKLQVDHGFASCRVAGSAGDLAVRSIMRARPHVWYRLTCARTAGSLAITMPTISANVIKILDYQVADGATGEVNTAKESPYLSVGAKIDTQGTIPTTSTDQFNGLIRSVFVEMGGRT